MKNIHHQGFRLQYLEIYNWGTFDEMIWKLQPKGKNSLLTGANGSGKTTLVDAIITLLVPPNSRHYNQSSGTKSKRERNEKTYTLGAYVTVQGESGLAAKTKYLRTKDEFSILLGTFYNADHQEYITLAQVRWFANNDLKRAYLISTKSLTISEHFQPLDTGGAWKRKLKKQYNTEEFSSFSKYSQRFSKIFGLKSEKALSLFAQTVGIKVLGNLNDFIRQNMLESYDAEQEFLKLYEHYESLLRAHNAIEKAKEQLHLLKPIIESGQHYQQLSEIVQTMRDSERHLLPFFARKRIDLYQNSIQNLKSDLHNKNIQIQEYKHSITQLNNQRNNLQINISTNQAYEQIQNIDKQCQQKELELKRREQQAQRYNQIAQFLTLKTDPTEKAFYKTLEQAKVQINLCEDNQLALEDKTVRVKITLKQAEATQAKLTAQLQSLQSRKNRIPMDQIRIREALLKKLKLEVSDLPFAAELFKVKENASEWEAIIETIFRPIALSLLVKKNQQEALLNAINRLDLKGKIAFYTLADPVEKFDNTFEKQSILQKISFHPKHDYVPYLQGFLYENYNYKIVNGISKLAKNEIAVNEKGLLKKQNYHERNAAANINTPQDYILGWENTNSILHSQRQLKTQIENIQKHKKQLQNIQSQQQQVQYERDQWMNLKTFDQFHSIDWKTSKKAINTFQKEKTALLKSSNQLQELERQLKDLKNTIATQEKEKEKLIETRGNVQSRRHDYEQKYQQAQEVAAQFESSNTHKYQANILSFLESDQNTDFNIGNIDKLERQITRKLTQARDQQARTLATTERKLSLSMQKFITPAQKILDKYPNWTADTSDLLADVKYLAHFDAMHQKIRKEDLPKYQKRFKDWLNERMIFDIANFKTVLENQEIQISESIAAINNSLLDIDFNKTPKTYIQLDINKTRDHAIRDFKEMLRNAMPDPNQLLKGDTIALENSFNKIKKIIEALAANETWRKKVTDVRNWLEFAADERYRADNIQRQYYVDSQSLSGGEKAKLAYTILASAIAYQFGIRNEGRRAKSFRFAVVDEAFSKVDPENSVYAMELFKQLNLQLMVVTPLDKINLAEPYIHSVHFVENRAKRNSQVYDLSMDVYEKQKVVFKENLKH